ncbi:Protein lin-28-like protein A [Plecturocebus cupreus]
MGPGLWAQPTTMGSVCNQQLAGGYTKDTEEAPEEAPEDAARVADEPQLLHCADICKWFNVCMGFGFLSLIACPGVTLDPQWMSCAPE